MNNKDIEKVSTAIRNAQYLFCFGDIGLPVPTNKLVNSVKNADLILIKLNDSNSIIKILSSISHDCTILILDSLPLEGKLETFFHKAINFQYSKLMMYDGVRENVMTVIYNETNSTNYDRNDQITIILVLRTGGDTYNHRYVNATAKNIRENLTYDAEIICLTDNPTGITEVDRIVEMEHDWPKWWGKMEMFKKSITTNKHCLYLDLDTVCFKNIDFICKLPAGFYGIRDFYHLNILQTGILKWEVNDESVRLYKNNLHHIDKYFNKGDHELIGECVKTPLFLQDIFPGEICSYKKHMAQLYKNYITPSIVCFHGNPRPHTIKHDLIAKHWKY